MLDGSDVERARWGSSSRRCRTSRWMLDGSDVESRAHHLRCGVVKSRWMLDGSDVESSPSVAPLVNTSRWMLDGSDVESLGMLDGSDVESSAMRRAPTSRHGCSMDRTSRDLRTGCVNQDHARRDGAGRLRRVAARWIGRRESAPSHRRHAVAMRWIESVARWIRRREIVALCHACNDDRSRRMLDGSDVESRGTSVSRVDQHRGSMDRTSRDAVGNPGCLAA
jgi:hypothetical protein